MKHTLESKMMKYKSWPLRASNKHFYNQRKVWGKGIHTDVEDRSSTIPDAAPQSILLYLTETSRSLSLELID